MDFTRLKLFMDALCAEKVPGSTVRVTLHGQTVFCYSAGFSDLESRRPMTGGELLNIFSCSKLATVTAALQLYERGAFLLTDPLYEYLPEYRTMQVRDENGGLHPAEKPITVGDLFGMTAGFDYDLKKLCTPELRAATGGRFDTVTVARSLARWPLAFEPGTHWQYSLGHDVLAALVSVVAGRPFGEVVRRQILEPLGMQQTFFHRPPEVQARMAALYELVPEQGAGRTAVEAQMRAGGGLGHFERRSPDPVDFIPGPDYDSGGAGLVTGADDYIRLVTALACGGRAPGGERLLAEGTVRLLHTNRLRGAQLAELEVWPQLTGYGYGLGVRTPVDLARAGSNGTADEFGWGGAAGASVLADPSLELGVFYAHHMYNALESWYQPRLRNVVYACLSD